MYESYRVRRRFGWNGWQFAVPGRCQCSTVEGSNQVTTRADELGRPGLTGKFDLNPCQDTDNCTGYTATECRCSDNGYCGLNGGGACGIKPYMYGGGIWIVHEMETPGKLWVLNRRYALYDPTLPAAEELIKSDDAYRVLAMGEPQPDIIYFKPGGERIESPDTNGSSLPESDSLVSIGGS